MGAAEEKAIFHLVLIGTMGFLLTVIFIIMLYTRYRNTLLKERLKTEELKHHYQLDLLRSNIQTQERERMRFSRDLHDEVGAVLSMLKMNLIQLNKSGCYSDEQRNYLVSLEELTIAALNSSRRISHELIPPALETFGLIHVMEGQASILQQGGIDMTLHYEAFERVPALVELGIYRILMELINNTIKHANAKSIAITFQLINSALHIRYCDDGRGFQTTEPAKGLGIKNIESRVAVLNGSVSFTTQHTTGMAVTIILPVKEMQNSHHTENIPRV
ncbi:sensor histidine kinase [Ohtaekwangia kribbensis]|uniref:histidine kinase n=1 Tax=Ohtaekwangia kribbensis TaxID=688913 RepID=A0ABW3JZA2_9BACT